MTPPVWLDPHGCRRPTEPCLQCGAPSPILRLTSEDLRRLGWAPFRTQRIPDWCGHSAEYVAWWEGAGWRMVVVWEGAV